MLPLRAGMSISERPYDPDTDAEPDYGLMAAFSTITA